MSTLVVVIKTNFKKAISHIPESIMALACLAQFLRSAWILALQSWVDQEVGIPV